jgi:hypothetical protein
MSLPTCFLLLLSACFLHAADRQSITPDYLQTDPEGGFRSGGLNNCGPVSAANGFFYLAAQGYPKLRPQTAQGDKAAQTGLIQKLCSADYMATDVKGRTLLPELLRGLIRHVREAGYQVERLEFQGLSAVPAQMETHRKANAPDLDWIKHSLKSRQSMVIAHLGWYEPDPKDTQLFRRKNGHYVTVVGLDNHSLIVHDPAPYAGKTASSDPLRLAPFPIGKLDSPHTTLPVSSAGYWHAVVPSMQRKGIHCLLESVVVLTLRPVTHD